MYQDAQLSIQVTSQETIQVHITNRIERYEKKETGFEPGAAGWVACSVLPSTPKKCEIDALESSLSPGSYLTNETS